MIRTLVKAIFVLTAISLVGGAAQVLAYEGTEIVRAYPDSDIIVEARIEQKAPISLPDFSNIERIEEKIIEEKLEVERIEARASKIREELAKRGAPLADYAKEIVIAGEKYGVEPELIAAISIIESGGGKITFLPHNAWGWGRRSWSNWETAIDEYTQGLANGYVSKGLDKPSEIAPIYCPPNSAYWSRNVGNVMNLMQS